MVAKYKVICDCFSVTRYSRAKKIETVLNEHAALGWEFVALESFALGIGFNLILTRLPDESRRPAE